MAAFFRDGILFFFLQVASSLHTVPSYATYAELVVSIPFQVVR